MSSSTSKRGIKLMLIASIGFGLMNVSVKYIPHIPVFEIILFRAVLTLLISYSILKKRKVNPWGTHHKFLVARGFFGAIGLLCFFYTLQHIQLANAIVIHYLSPIFTTLIASFYFREKVKGMQWIAFAISFLGIVLIKGFSKIEPFDFVVGIAGAFFSGLAYNAIRSMKDKEDADVIIFYHPLVSLPVVILYLLIFPGTLVMPQGADWIFLISTAIFTQVGQYCMTRAHQHDTAARISSISYIGMIWAVLFGKFLFHDSYSASVLSSMLLVVGGVILNLNLENIKRAYKRFTQ